MTAPTRPHEVNIYVLQQESNNQSTAMATARITAGAVSLQGYNF